VKYLTAAVAAVATVAAAYQSTNSIIGTFSYSLTETVDTAEATSNNITRRVCGGSGYITCNTENSTDRAIKFGEKSVATGASIAAISACVAILACGHLLLLYFDKKCTHIVHF
jgi:hypothetical protein